MCGEHNSAERERERERYAGCETSSTTKYNYYTCPFYLSHNKLDSEVHFCTGHHRQLSLRDAYHGNWTGWALAQVLVLVLVPSQQNSCLLKGARVQSRDPNSWSAPRILRGSWSGGLGSRGPGTPRGPGWKWVSRRSVHPAQAWKVEKVHVPFRPPSSSARGSICAEKR